MAHATAWAIAVCSIQSSTAQTLHIDDGYGKSGTHYDLCFVGDDTGFVCGDPGLFVTYDGGTQWSAEAKVTGNFRSVDFATRTDGHAVGNDGLYARTTDGGETWETRDAIATVRLRAVSFPDERNGFAAGDNGTVVATADGGDTWRTLETAFVKPGTTDRSTLTGVCFIDRQTGFVSGTGGALYKTTDGGENWQDRSPGPEGVWDMTFTSDSIGYASGAGSLCYKTVDRGESWTTITLPAPDGQEWSLWAIAFIDDDVGVAVGGHIFFTNDGGASWSLVKSGGQELRGLHAVNDSTLIAVGKASRQVAMRIEGLATAVVPPQACRTRVRAPRASLFLLNGRSFSSRVRRSPQCKAACGRTTISLSPSHQR